MFIQSLLLTDGCVHKKSHYESKIHLNSIKQWFLENLIHTKEMKHKIKSSDYQHCIIKEVVDKTVSLHSSKVKTHSDL